MQMHDGVQKQAYKHGYEKPETHVNASRVMPAGKVGQRGAVEPVDRISPSQRLR